MIQLPCILAIVFMYNYTGDPGYPGPPGLRGESGQKGLYLLDAIEFLHCCKFGLGVKGDARKPGNRGDPGDRGPRGLVGKM